MLRIGEKIKELRLRDGRTQETVAAALGMTAQAVSRWEKGVCCPDMELIPSIANYFGVSIDELFGYDNERAKKVSELAERVNELNRRNNGADVCMDECIALARQSLIEFPGNEELTAALASALFNAGYVRRGELHVKDAEGYSVYDTETHRTYSEWQEAIKLYEKLLPSLNGGELRKKAVDELSQLYKNTGEHEKALRLAEDAPELGASRPFLRIKAFDGREAVAASGEALLEAVQKCAELIVGIVLADGSIPPASAAELLNNAEGLFGLICTEGDFGRNRGLLACVQLLRSYYLWLASEKDAAFAALSGALDHARRLDSLRDNGREYYSSPLLRLVKTRKDQMPAGFSFCAELPEVWPWWDVDEYERVKSEMQADERWREWAEKAKNREA